MAYQPSANVKVTKDYSKLLKFVDSWSSQIVSLLQKYPLDKNSALYDMIEAKITGAKFNVTTAIESYIKANRPSIQSEIERSIESYYKEVYKGMTSAFDSLLEQRGQAYSISPYDKVNEQSNAIVAKYQSWSKNVFDVLKSNREKALQLL